MKAANLLLRHLICSFSSCFTHCALGSISRLRGVRRLSLTDTVVIQGGVGPQRPPYPVAKAAPSSEGPRITHCDPRGPHCTQAPAAKAPETPVAGAPGAAPVEGQAIGKAMHPRLGHNG